MGGIGWVVCWWMDGGFFGCMCESWIGKWLIHGLVGRSERCEKQSISLNMSVHVFPHFFFPLMPFCRDRVSLGSCFTGQLPGIGTVVILASLQMLQGPKAKSNNKSWREWGGGGWGLWGSFENLISGSCYLNHQIWFKKIMFPISSFRMQTLLSEPMLICCSQWTVRLRILETKCTWSGLENLLCYSVGAFVFFFGKRELILSDATWLFLAAPDALPAHRHLDNVVWTGSWKVAGKGGCHYCHFQWSLVSAASPCTPGKPGSTKVRREHAPPFLNTIMGKSLVQTFRKKKGNQFKNT